MSAVRVTIQAGVCGFVTEATVRSEDSQHVTFAITSTCEKIRGLAERLPEAVDAYDEISAGFEGEFFQTVRSSLRGCCAGCVVPAGLFKAMQVAAGLALPRDIAVTLRRAEEESG